jgi:hypothetical protein
MHADIDAEEPKIKVELRAVRLKKKHDRPSLSPLIVKGSATTHKIKFVG